MYIHDRFSSTAFARHVSMCCLTLCVVLWASPVHAQSTGSVTGTVVDASDTLPVEAVEVYITGLDAIIYTDAEGAFSFSFVPAGQQTVRVSFIGYSTLVRELTVSAGETTELSLRITPTVLKLDEVVVTGTSVEEFAIDLPYAVTAVDRAALAEQGAPQLVELFKNLSVSHGVIGERQSWYNSTGPPASVQETVASVNLRGLGPSRTLVLFNGRRQVYLPARLIGGRFVDVNAVPAIAISRIEVLKEGASAVYGSDAVAGVANFVTRSDFEGLEVATSHEYYADAGDTYAGAIWGGDVAGAHAVFAAEMMYRQELRVSERPWSLRPFPQAGGWSYTGNPGAFYRPSLTGNEGANAFVNELVAAHGDAERRFLDPRCVDFGGHIEDATCRFRYAPWDNLIEKSRHIRAFGEINGRLGDRSGYRIEGLWAQAVTPDWLTTPSFPPISPYDGTQIVPSGNPGRQAFCGMHADRVGFASGAECLEDDWYFFGRLVGNSGPGRTLARASGTQRISASVDHAFEAFGGRSVKLDVGVGYSRATNNVNLPAEYAYRKFLAFRGFGGPDCGVDVEVDRAAPSGMRLGALNGAVPGQGACMYYNPFSNALRYSAQPGAAFQGMANPDHAGNLANSPALIGWINEELDLENKAELFVADAVLTGGLVEGLAAYAVGYQFRRTAVSAVPNDPANQNTNPCAVPGDVGCRDKVGPYTFTTGYYPYDDARNVHRFFAEVPLTVGARFDAQVAANYEFHEIVSSFDPKFAMRIQATDALIFRGSVQSTLRVPSVDELNEDRATGLDWVAETGTYKPIDTFGNADLKPERALTYNVGAAFSSDHVRATLDYWSYNFRDAIGVLPHGGITALYHQGGAARAAVQRYITCPGGASGCDSQLIERVRVNAVNWPGITTSGIDWHLSTRFAAGAGVLSGGFEGTWTRSYFVKALEVSGVELAGEQEGAGYLNRYNPSAPPIPKWKSRVNAGYHRSLYSLVSYLNYIPSYINENESEGSELRTIDSFATLDVSAYRHLPGGFDVTLSVLNLLDKDPPFVNWESAFDGFTHSPKGRRVKLSITWRLEEGR
ncbi:MAG: TonB-dependent receptor [Bacteroidetes bacterium SB0662_bin_6]|nr:TonB-dependent receptor [Bacteroidetes bacterium SB0668_bin_1]MYE03961.1 TonB-dependent receptor [Bacteroidetes bacterium SB0662_bin_6]